MRLLPSSAPPQLLPRRRRSAFPLAASLASETLRHAAVIARRVIGPWDRSSVRLALWILGSLGFAITLLATLLPGRLVLQGLSPQSVPFTVGLSSSTPTRWEVGSLVAFRTRSLLPYYSAGTPFTKIVAAVPGDRIVQLGRDFYINGHYITTARTTDSRGRPAWLFQVPFIDLQMSRSPGPWSQDCREASASMVPNGALFVLGTHERSFDSRYWGWVRTEEITGRVVPIW